MFSWASAAQCKLEKEKGILQLTSQCPCNMYSLERRLQRLAGPALEIWIHFVSCVYPVGLMVGLRKLFSGARG